MNRIAELRKLRGITQKELAQAIAISPSAIAMYETNQREPNHDTLRRLSEFFKVSVDYILNLQPKALTPELKARQDAIDELNKLFTAMTPEQQQLLISLAENMKR